MNYDSWTGSRRAVEVHWSVSCSKAGHKPWRPEMSLGLEHPAWLTCLCLFVVVVSSKMTIYWGWDLTKGWSPLQVITGKNMSEFRMINKVVETWRTENVAGRWCNIIIIYHFMLFAYLWCSCLYIYRYTNVYVKSMCFSQSLSHCLGFQVLYFTEPLSWEDLLGYIFSTPKKKALKFDPRPAARKKLHTALKAAWYKKDNIFASFCPSPLAYPFLVFWRWFRGVEVLGVMSLGDIRLAVTTMMSLWTGYFLRFWCV